MSAHSRAWLQIHFCVVLWGFTAILGKVITLEALPLVWWRMLLVTLAVLPWPAFWRAVRPLPPRLALIYAGIGALVTLHWLTFYGSIKLANASVAAACMALSPVFVSMVEPVLVRRPFNRIELLLGVGVIPGVVLVVGGTPAAMRTGMAVGVFSALVVAVFSSLNKRFIGSSDALAVTGIQMGVGAAMLPVVSMALPAADSAIVMPDVHDATLLVVMAMACTLLPYWLSLKALRHLSAFAVTLAVNMEPIYAILLAVVLLNEQRDLTPRFYAGGALIMAIVFAYPWASRRLSVSGSGL